jgi:hypothetical protein
MSPTALAETIASIEQAENLDAAEKNTVRALMAALICNVGEQEAWDMLAVANCG